MILIKITWGQSKSYLKIFLGEVFNFPKRKKLKNISHISALPPWKFQQTTINCLFSQRMNSMSIRAKNSVSGSVELHSLCCPWAQLSFRSKWQDALKEFFFLCFFSSWRRNEEHLKGEACFFLYYSPLTPDVWGGGISHSLIH